MVHELFRLVWKLYLGVGQEMDAYVDQRQGHERFILLSHTYATLTPHFEIILSISPSLIRSFTRGKSGSARFCKSKRRG